MGKTGLRTVLAVGLVLAAGPAAADWLVLSDGTRLETRGPWEERGKLVVFTTADGHLASLRLAEVDLEASREATQAAASQPEAAPEPPEPEPREAVFVLTDENVRRAAPAAEGEDAAAAAGQEAAEPRLVVTDWQEGTLPNDDGIRLTGTLRNVSDAATTRVRLTALVYDTDGELLATGDAMLSSQALMPDQQARFQVEFPGIYAVSAVRFETTTLPLDVGPPEGETEEAETEGPGAV